MISSALNVFILYRFNMLFCTFIQDKVTTEPPYVFSISVMFLGQNRIPTAQ